MTLLNPRVIVGEIPNRDLVSEKSGGLPVSHHILVLNQIRRKRAEVLGKLLIKRARN